LWEKKDEIVLPQEFRKVFLKEMLQKQFEHQNQVEKWKGKVML
jgi:hypothetical protein